MTNIVIFSTILFCIISIGLESVAIILNYRHSKLGVTNPFTKKIKGGKIPCSIILFIPYILAIALFVIYPTVIGRYAIIVSILLFIYILIYYAYFELDHFKSFSHKIKRSKVYRTRLIASGFILILLLVLLPFFTSLYLDLRLGPTDDEFVVSTYKSDEIKITSDISIHEHDKLIQFHSCDYQIIDYAIFNRIDESETSLNIVEEGSIKYPYYVLTTTVHSYVSEVDPRYKITKVEKHYDIYACESNTIYV